MEGAKTSFCIEDVDEVISGGSAQTYTECGTDLQGLTPGWSDIYASDPFGQWIVIGDQPLPDGKYGLKSTADPRNLLDEGKRKKRDQQQRHHLFHGHAWRDPDPAAQVAVS